MSGPAPLAARVDRLLRDHADWAPYAAVLRETARAFDPGTRHDHHPGPVTVTLATDRAAGAPLLAGATLHVDARAVDRWLRRLLRIGAEHGAAAALGESPRSRALDALALVEASIDHDVERLAALAGNVGVEAAALGAVVHVAARPLLHRARIAHDVALPECWEPGYCPVCGAVAALAEARGLEGTRRLRCARCGSDWWTEWLRCSYCDNRDHEALGSLVSDGAGETRRAETCDRCRTYLKLVTTLAALPLADLALEDLATVDLDVAALERGYRRPPTPGVRLAARVVPAEDTARAKTPFGLGALFGRS